MSFSLNHYVRIRPFLYHLTAQENIERIKALKRLESTKSLLVAANRMDLLRRRRPNNASLIVDKHQVSLRDQAPLHEGNIEFAGGWDLNDLVEALNNRIFFWPGTESGPISYGERHFERYKDEQPVILRVRFESLNTRNQQNKPLFCNYNSGSPRQNQGRPSPCGPNTFLSAERFPYTPGQVKEVTFLEYVILPNDTEYSTHINGPWKLLFSTL
jgi:hypothetical protein